MYAIGIAPSAERDIERIHAELGARARSGKVSVEFPDQWFEDVMEGIHRLDPFAKRHPYAPERAIWGRDVRNVILSVREAVACFWRACAASVAAAPPADRESMSRELRIVAYTLAGLAAARVLVLAVDGVVDHFRRRSLYRS